MNETPTTSDEADEDLASVSQKPRSLEAKEVAALWIHENAIVNQKTNYYIASVSFLAWPTTSLWINGSLHLAILLACLGITVSLVAFISVARTAAYRDHWRKELIDSSIEYKEMFQRVSFRWYQRISSNTLLVCTPILGMTVWLVVVGSLLAAYPEARK